MIWKLFDHKNLNKPLLRKYFPRLRTWQLILNKNLRDMFVFIFIFIRSIQFTQRNVATTASSPAASSSDGDDGQGECCMLGWTAVTDWALQALPLQSWHFQPCLLSPESQPQQSAWWSVTRERELPLILSSSWGLKSSPNCQIWTVKHHCEYLKSAPIFSLNVKQDTSRERLELWLR